MCMTTKTMLVSGVTLAALMTLGLCVDLALNKPTYIASAGPLNHDSNLAVDGSDATFGRFELWFVLDLTRDYMGLEVVLDYLALGTSKIQAELSLAHPFWPSQRMLCQAKQAGEPQTRNTMSLVCPTGQRARFVRILRSQVTGSRDFRCYQIRVVGRLVDDCARTPMKMKKLSGTRMVSSSSVQVSGINNLDCASQCFRKPGCQGFNYNHETMACEMLITIGNGDTHSSHGDWQINFFSF